MTPDEYKKYTGKEMPAEMRERIVVDAASAAELNGDILSLPVPDVIEPEVVERALQGRARELIGEPAAMPTLQGALVQVVPANDEEAEFIQLTDEQIHFIEAYCSTGLVLESADVAGCSRNSALSWLKDEKFSKHCEWKKSIRAKNKVITKESVMAFADDVMRGFRKADRGQIKAMELLAKSFGEKMPLDGFDFFEVQARKGNTSITMRAER